MVEYLVGVCVFSLLAYSSWRFYKFLSGFFEWLQGEEERLARLAAANAREKDKEKPWPVRLVKWQDGVKLIAKLDSVEVRYGPKVIGHFQGWKIYETVRVGDTFYAFDSTEHGGVAPSKHDDHVLILAPGLIYRPVAS